jgi:formylglycine-generating enzyme required for sulfatase activity
MNGEGYLIPADAPRPEAGGRFKLKALSMRRFGEWVREARSKHVLAVFDSCFSGTIFKTSRSKPPSAVTRSATLPVRQFLTAGDADQEVLDDGRFRKLFIRALKREEPADLNRDGYLTGSELGMYLTDRLTNLTESRQTPRYGKLLDEDYDRGDFVFLLAGGDSVITRPTPKAGTTLSVECTVSGARVFMDNQMMGYTNLPEKTVSPGSHVIRVEKEGYAPYRKNMQLEQGRSVSLFVDLVPKGPAKGRIFVDTDPEDARVRILNIAPVFYQGIDLEPGRYQMEISAADYVTRDFWVDLEAGEDKQLNIRLERKETEPAAVSNKISNDLGMEFVYIEPGSFMMGSPSNESGRDNDEKQHRVTLTRGFYLQTTEVTQRQWKSVMGSNPSKFSGCNSCPVEMVSWNDVQGFIRKLNRREGKSYRLPTEAEWEYACRAGSGERFCFGNDEGRLGEYAWYGNNSGGKPHPVGQKRPNSWGLYDMHGNVWEWCQDRFGDYPYGTVTDPTGPSSGSFRVGRGGGWNFDPRNCRSAIRDGGDPGDRGDILGFRLALSPVR